MLTLRLKQSGFTLIEAIAVIIITAILGALASSFSLPIKAYFAATARADLTDVADTAMRRMAREIHTALPNSVRVDSAGKYIEFLPTITGGRYRASAAASSSTVLCGTTLAQDQDVLDFTIPDNSFEVICGLSATPVTGNELVVYNYDPSIVYSGTNVATIAAGTTTNIVKFSSMQFPMSSPNQRFQIIGGPVSFVCDDSTKTLWRYTGYARQQAQPVILATLNNLVGVNKSSLATGIDCNNSRFSYASGGTSRNDLVAMELSLTSGGNSVTLLHQVHVQNVP
jgi:MSHA biogenesis protein MshO